MAQPRFPSLYQINTRVWLTELSRALGRPATLDDIPDAELDRLAEMGFDWIWFLSVWQTGPAAQRDLAQQSRVAQRVRGDAARPARGRHRRLGIRDHRLHRASRSRRRRGARPPARAAAAARAAADARFRPEPHGPGSPLGRRASRLLRPRHRSSTWRARRRTTRRVQTRNGPICCSPMAAIRISPAGPTRCSSTTATRPLQEAMIGELRRIAGQCDGVRCDMAMLVLPDVFERTWGIRAEPFWPKATERVRRAASGLLLHGRGLLGSGMDAAAAGLRLRLRQAAVRPPSRWTCPAGARALPRRARLPGQAGPLPGKPRRAACRGHLSRRTVHEAAAVITFLSPGLRFFHQGQFEGRKKRISPHLVRAPAEAEDEKLKRFYERLLAILRHDTVRNGAWRRLDCIPAWDGNGSCDSFLAFGWEGTDGQRLLVAVNYAPNQSQCYVLLPHEDLKQGMWRLKDRMDEVAYDREGRDLVARGLYLDLPAWHYHVFQLERF